MNKSFFIILSAAVIVLSLGAVAAFQYGFNQDLPFSKEKAAAGLSSADENIPHKRSCCAEDEPSGDFSDNSIYQIDTKWTDQSGNKFSLSDLKGKKVVLAMIFANCTYACPLIVNDMKKVESAISESEKQQTEFILVSIDPERDTPKALTEYARSRQLDLNRWRLLTGKDKEVRTLAAILGFKYKKDEKGDYSHSNLINVLNKQGEIVFQHEGLNKEIQDVVSHLTQAI